MSYNSRYTGRQVDTLLSQVNEKVDASEVVRLIDDQEIHGIKTFADDIVFKKPYGEYYNINITPYTSVKTNDESESIINLSPNMLIINNNKNQLMFYGSTMRPFYNGIELAFKQDINASGLSKDEADTYYVLKADYNGLYQKVNLIESNYISLSTLNSALSKYQTISETESLLLQKVDKVDGKQLSTEDFTTAYKTKLNALENYNDSELRQLISESSSNNNQAIELASFLEGVSKVTSLRNLPITHRLIVANISTDQSLSVDGTPNAGRELHIIVHNLSENSIAITLPDAGNFINTSDPVLQIDAFTYGEINIISDGELMYIKHA